MSRRIQLVRCRNFTELKYYYLTDDEYREIMNDDDNNIAESTAVSMSAKDYWTLCHNDNVTVTIN